MKKTLTRNHPIFKPANLSGFQIAAVSYRGEAGKTSGYYVPKAAESEVRRGVEAWSQLQTQLRQLSALNKERALQAARVKK